VETVREMEIRPQVAQTTQRSGGSAIDARTSRHESYAVSQSKRLLIEKAFGWMKQIGRPAANHTPPVSRARTLFQQVPNLSL
jgi:hypothetical protein